MRVPTKQIQELSDREVITPSAQRCLTWLFRKCPAYNQAFTVDLHDFNTWIGKHRKKGRYSPSSLGKIRDQVIRLPILRIKRQWSAHVFELVIEQKAVLKDLSRIVGDTASHIAGVSPVEAIEAVESAIANADEQTETEFAFVKNKRGIMNKRRKDFALQPIRNSSWCYLDPLEGSRG